MKREEAVTYLMDQISDQTYSALCWRISYYGISHKVKLPKAVIDLYNQCVNKKEKYNGISTAAIMSGIWFHF
ncbi:hypothetical protein [Companilactobacillus kimchiensis]|uniref:Bacteriocin immunity protein n=1 Tax=Companilactobacillus kimchiensis TaxID=993692 RepID=A0A0R2LMS6_9LACO|nr:hypothetical protein [Companilactobacillus kimchiensis]KRO00770.1 hypothetical protein IV57_GL000090 [Companilactobacillus kimchiensis]